VCGANHRELGRSSSVHPDVASALRAIEHLQANIAHAVLSHVITTSAGIWAWRMTIDAAPVATSSRAYFRQRECAYAAAACVAAIAGAAIPTLSGRRPRAR
jgi:hypothetical protein